MECQICKKILGQITSTHLRKHDITVKRYKEDFKLNKVINEEIYNKLVLKNILYWNKNKKIKTINCKFCKKQFVGYPSRLFCSKRCRSIFNINKFLNAVNKVPLNMRKKRRDAITKIQAQCSQCKKDIFIDIKRQLKNNFCNKLCYMNFLKITENNNRYQKKSWSKGLTKETSNIVKKVSLLNTGKEREKRTERIIIECLNCKKKFIFLKTKKRRFCSHKCHASGKFNGMFNKTHTEETIKKIFGKRGKINKVQVLQL